MSNWITGISQRIVQWLGRSPDSKPRDQGGSGAVPPTTAAQPERCVTVVIPALNEAKQIAEVVRYAWSDPATAEVIVIDDSSTDDTASIAAAAGARVVTSTMLGKGPSMHDGLLEARCSYLVYLDGDLEGLSQGIVTELCRPLFNDEADFVKAKFGRAGGRVTELTAKPMLKVFFPEIAGFSQPLGGIIAARANLLRSLRFEDGYGVDVGLLIDAHTHGARIAEVDIGRIGHDSQPLPDLALMAAEVARVIFSRAREAGRLHVGQITAMYESQRQAASSLEYILTRRRGRSRLVLIDMDGTITPDRFVVQLAKATGRERELGLLLDGPDGDSITRSAAIAALFRFVPRQQFEAVAREMTLRPGVIEWVKEMKRAGFMVGVISDSWFVAAEVMRRRIFADFALAHVLQFDSDVCTGQLNINPAFCSRPVSERRFICKSLALARFRDAPGEPPVDTVWAVGDNLNDLAMLRAADRAIVVDPKSSRLLKEVDAVCVNDFEALLPLVPSQAEQEATTA